jgi:hypothetical protein
MGLAACGGGTITAGGGSGGTGVGTVSGFGSVIVNGIRYATDNATIVIGGVENRPESELKVGMRVRVDGTFSTIDNNGRATRIEAIREIRGPLDDNGVDNVLNRLRVAGQTVLVDPATIFDNVADLLELQAIQAGPPIRYPEVEVHGAADDNGAIHATYIWKAGDDFRLSDNVAIRGKMKDFNPTLRTFAIGSQAVTFPLFGLERVPPGALFDNGIYVEVRGVLSSIGGTGTLNASRIEVLDNAVGSTNDPVRVEGYVVSGTSKGSFVLLGPGGNVSVDGVGATLIPTSGTIVPGQKVQVEGAIIGKVLKASVIRIRPTNSVRIEDAVWGSPDNVTGTFKVLFNKTVQVDGYTRFKDSAGDVRDFRLAKLNPNDNVQVVGSYDGSNVTAILVERIVPDDPGLVLLQGPVDNTTVVPTVSFDILGIRVTSVSDFNNTEFKDASGNPVAMETFFDTVLPALRPDQVVKVKRGVFYPEVTPIIRDDSLTRKMEVEIEQINN